MHEPRDEASGAEERGGPSCWDEEERGSRPFVYAAVLIFFVVGDRLTRESERTRCLISPGCLLLRERSRHQKNRHRAEDLLSGGSASYIVHLSWLE